MIRSCACALLSALSVSFAQSPTANVLHQFDDDNNASPTSNLIQLPGGDYKILFHFAADGSQCASGASQPTSNGGAIMQAGDGNIYGVCSAGGRYGKGTVFQLTPSGQFTLLHSFHGTDGSAPAGALVAGLDGNLYGVTLNGGLSEEFGGTIFRVGKSGFSTIYQFDASTGASNPNAGLTLGPGGNIYGMYQFNAIGNGFGGPGGVFQIDTSGNITFPSYFQSVPWSCAPVIAPRGGIFSLTQASVIVGDAGQTLEGIPSGSDYAYVALDLPHYFGTDFVNFFGCMILATDGHFYANGISAIEYPTMPFVELRMDVATQQTQFLDLDPYGSTPVLAPLEGADGKLYIVNNGGGVTGLGNVLTLDYGIAPPAPLLGGFVPSSGSAGTAVVIGGNFFVGVTSVALNGKAVPYRVRSSSVIDFVIPSGAASGTISVSTPNGTVTSSGTFTVQ